MVGILDDLDAEKNRILGVNPSDRPDPWAGSEDKLEEWIGLPPLGSSRPKRQSPQPQKRQPQKLQPLNESRMVVDVILLHSITDVILPSDFRDQIEYARVLKTQSLLVKSGYLPGYTIEVSIGNILHRRRVFDPVKTVSDARQSSEFILALTKAIKSISDYKRTKIS